MQTRLHPAESRVNKLSAEIPARFIAFDVLVWKGVEAWHEPLSKRRARLERSAKRFELSPATRDREEAHDWLERFEAIGLDGVIAKRRDAAYLPGSRDGVVKVKPERTADCVVVGVRWKSKPDRIATLLLGLYGDDGEIDYVGSAAVAPARHDEIAKRVLPLLENAPERRFSEPNRWGGGELEESPVRPELVVEVRYDKVQSNRFRHGTKLIRFRDDKDPKQCTWREVRPPVRAKRLRRSACSVSELVLGLLRARRLDARRLAGHLREVRRVRRLADAFRLLALDPLEQDAQVAHGVVDPGVHVAELARSAPASSPSRSPRSRRPGARPR